MIDLKEVVVPCGNTSELKQVMDVFNACGFPTFRNWKAEDYLFLPNRRGGTTSAFGIIQNDGKDVFGITTGRKITHDLEEFLIAKEK